MIKGKLKALSFAQVFSSPLKRCASLAFFLSNDVVVDDRLKELNFGLWEGVSWEDIFSTDEGKHWFADYLNYTCPGGESFQDLGRRVHLFMSDLTHVSGNILIVTHDGVMRCLLNEVGLIDLPNIFDLTIPHGQILRIDKNKLYTL